MLEFEKKVLLTENEYRLLAGRFRNAFIDSQTNFYFDTEDLYMNRKGITCRVRKKDGKYKATVKKHDTGDLSRSTEIGIYEGSEINAEVFGALGMTLQGVLTTKRCVIYKDFFLKAVLDRNTYLGYTDYEIEVEYIRQWQTKALDFMKQIGDYLAEKGAVASTEDFIFRIGKGNSKSARFVERKLLIEGEYDAADYR